MRVPPFWRDRPRLWFITFEAATHDLKKGQAQLAQLVIAQLEKQDIEQISDLLYNPPAEKYYDALKARLISVYEESEGRQFQKLLSEMELGEQRPSQLLRRMRDLARDKVPDSTLRLMWMNHLPSHVRSVLVVSDTISKTAALDELSLLADKMMEQSQEVSAVSLLPSNNQTPSPQPKSDTQYLVEEIRRLSLEVASLRTRPSYYQDHQRSRSPYNQRTNRNRYTYNARSPSRQRTDYGASTATCQRTDYGASTATCQRTDYGGSTATCQRSDHCYYHQRFGRRARRCQSPCTFKSQQQQQQHNNVDEASSLNYQER